MRIKLMTCVAVAALSAGAAHAQDGDDGRGVYIALNAGLADLSDTKLVYQDDGGTFGGTGAVDVLNAEAKTKSAFQFGGTIGYDFGMIRADVEVNYSRNKLSGLQINSVNGAAVTTISAADAADFCDYAEVDNCSVSGNTIKFSGGRVRQLSGIANVWFDIPVSGTITPYIGGGAGIGGFETGGEGKARFTWQLGAGVAVKLSPNVSITGDYRYRRISGATFTDSGFPDYAFKVGDLKTSAFTAGIRFGF